MKPGEFAKFVSDQARGYDTRPKIHLYLGRTEHYRAPDEYMFLFVSSGDYGNDCPIAAIDNNFLEHDSFISCGNIVFYSKEYLRSVGLKVDGAIDIELLRNLRGHIVNSEVMVLWQINEARDAIDRIVSACGPPKLATSND